MDEYFTASCVSPGIYHIYENAGVCCTLILGSKSSLLMDTGYGFCDLPAFIRTLTKLPLIIINTHGHLDHSGGNFRFSETALIHQDEYSIYDSYQRDKESMLTFLKKRHTAGKIPAPFPENFDEEAYLTYKQVPFQPARNGQIFDLGDRILEVFFLPGHSKGSLSVFDHMSGTLMAGDTIDKSLWMMFDHSAPPETLYARLQLLKEKFPIRKILASHTKAPYPPEMLDAVLSAINRRNPEEDSIFVHPRHGYQALHHKEPVYGIAGVKQIHLVYPFPCVSR